MINLMKYEARKSLFSKLILLVVIGIFELLFLYGLFFTTVPESSVTYIGFTGLILSSLVGIGFIGIESLLTLYRDLNTKQSYMLFMTPHNSYTILAAKIIENAIAILICGIFFVLLEILDITLICAKYGDLRELASFISNMFYLEINVQEYTALAVMGFFEILFSWILLIVIGYLAITLSSSVLSGKKFNGIVSFILFLILEFSCSRLTLSVSVLTPKSWNDITAFIVVLLFEILLAAVVYVITSYIMEKKLSV